MNPGKKDISKELVIDMALQLIEKNGSVKDVNLRGIAKELGCAHTNLYNYFNSLDELFWEALGRVLQEMINYVDARSDFETDPQKRLVLILSNIIDFSMAHPEWYRLIWLESLGGGQPAPDVRESLKKPGMALSAVIGKANVHLSEERVRFIGNILTTYMHGELSRWINNRSFYGSLEETKSMILSNINYLYQLLINEKEN